MRSHVKYFAVFTAFALCGCISLSEQAEPERFMGFDCEQLDQMAESYRTSPQVLLQEDDRVFNNRDQDPNSLSRDRSLNSRYEKERRSLALARRQKGC